MNAPATSSQIGKSAFWSVLNQSVGQMLVLGVFLVTARFVSKEDFGIMAASMQVVEFFRQVLLETIGTTFYSRKSPSDEDYNAGFFIVLTTGALSALSVFALAGPISSLLGHQEIETVLRWISLLLLTVGISKMHEIWLTKSLRFRSLAIRSIVSIGIGGAVGITMAINGGGIYSLIAQQIVTSLVSALWLWSAASWKPGMKTSRDNVFSILKFSRHVSLSRTITFAGNQGDVFFTSYYLGAVQTGVYNAGKRLTSAIGLMLNSGLNSVALPVMAGISDDTRRLSDAYLQCVALTSFISAPLYAGLAILSSDIVSILLGAKWADVAPVLSILAISGYVVTIGQYNTNIFLVKEKPQWQTKLVFLSCALDLATLIIFTRYGLLAMVGALAVKNILFNFLSCAITARLLEQKYKAYFLAVAPSLLSALVMGAGIYTARSFLLGDIQSWAALLLLVPAGAILYFLLMWLFDKSAIMGILSIVKQMLKRH